MAVAAWNQLTQALFHFSPAFLWSFSTRPGGKQSCRCVGLLRGVTLTTLSSDVNQSTTRIHLSLHGGDSDIIAITQRWRTSADVVDRHDTVSSVDGPITRVCVCVLGTTGSVTRRLVIGQLVDCMSAALVLSDQVLDCSGAI